MTQPPFPVEVAATHGRVPHDMLARAEQVLREVSRLSPAPVLHGRVGIEHDEDPAVERRVIAKAGLNVNGRWVRAHVAAPQFDEALDLLQARLRRGLEILSERRLARRMGTGAPAPGSWRHGDMPTARPSYYPRPAAERELVRRTSYAIVGQTLQEAAIDLELLDHDWILFVETSTGQDAVLARAAHDYRLIVAGDRDPDISGSILTVERGGPVATMTLADAIQALELSGEPFLFFVDADTGRGSVVYLRYDGHYGEVVPSADVPAA
jgi:hypothetical protein